MKSKIFFTAFFHIYGFNKNCLTIECQSFHFGGIDRSKLIVFNVLSILFIFGQIFGYYIVRKGINYFKECGLKGSYFHRIEYSSMVIRGLLSMLCLGILCVFLDIIIFSMTFIKYQNNLF